MKQLLITLHIAVFFLSLTGCRKDNEKYGETVTLSAPLGGGEKTEIYDGTKMKWSAGDKVTINNVEYIAEFPLEDYTTATFENVEAATKYQAYYPSNLYKNGSYVLPQTQKYNEDVLSFVNPMYAVTTTNTLRFHNICALVKLEVKGKGIVRKIVVSSDDNLCGEFSVSESDGKYSAVISKGYKTLTLSCGAGVTLSETTATTFYIALPQGTLRNLKFTLRDDSGGRWKSDPVNANLIAGTLYTKSFEKGDYKYPPVGALYGEFSVSATETVYFSKGNLQFHTTDKIWRFAENQYDLLDNTVSEHTTYDYAENSGKWIDLFGWGTSGYNHGATAYQPWSTSNKNGDYYAYGDVSKSLFDSDGKADWGYNAINNGGNVEKMGWRSLTGGGSGEWKYLFSTRGGTDALRYAEATVNNVCGYILLPDDWSTDTYALQSVNNATAGFAVNLIDESTWRSTLEPADCVFLPASGCRNVTTVANVGSYGYYWSSKRCCDDIRDAYRLYFSSTYLNLENHDDLLFGCSVRLVFSVED